MKRIVGLILVFAFSVFAQTYHNYLSGASIHTPFRFIYADSAARVAATPAATDTTKLALQLSNYSVWILKDNSPLTWVRAQRVDTVTAGLYWDVQKIAADTLIGTNRVAGNPVADSLSGGTDWVTAKIRGLDAVQGNPTTDSLAGGIWWSGTGATFSDSVYIDTLTSAKANITNLSGTGATFSDSVYVDTLNVGVITGDLKTVDWTAYTPTLGGWSGAPTITCYYKRIGSEVIVTYYVNGTSNSATTTFTLPVDPPVTLGTSTSLTTYNLIARYTDNGTVGTGGLAYYDGSLSTVLCKKSGDADFTASGAKNIRGVFRYFVD